MDAAGAVALAGALSATLLVWWELAAVGPGGRRRAADRFVRRAGPPAAAGSVPELTRRVVRRDRFVLGGVAAGLVGGQALSTDLQGSPLAAGYLGLALAAAAGALTDRGSTRQLADRAAVLSLPALVVIVLGHLLGGGRRRWRRLHREAVAA